MINNYIKDGLLPRANDKKYSREHLACLLMIARLKQTLSVKDTGLLLKSDIADGSIEDYFNGFQHLVAGNGKKRRGFPSGRRFGALLGGSSPCRFGLYLKNRLRAYLK